MKKIVIIFTGGTIAMSRDKHSNAQIPALTGAEILQMTPDIDKIVKFDFINFSNIPGPHMSPKKMSELSATIDELLASRSYVGAVVTHGTDSMEETAYFVDLTLQTRKPVVFIGAMRSSSDMGWDGPGNLIDAVYTAQHPDSKNRGSMIVMNGEIHVASLVTKTNTHTLNAFESAGFGPVGFIDNGKVFFYQKYIRRQVIATKDFEYRVDLVKTATGMDSRMIRFCVESGCKGLVIEGMGRGNVPPDMVSGIEYAISQNIPVVLVSRCLMGKVLDSYGYPGAGKELTQLGVIMGDNLPGQKARIKLMIALGKTKNMAEIKDIFEKDFY